MGTPNGSALISTWMSSSANRPKRLFVESRNREPVHEPERVQHLAARPHDELMRDEVEADVEVLVSRAHAGASSALACRRREERSTSDSEVASKPGAPSPRSATRGEASPSSPPTARAEAPAARSCACLREVDSKRDLVLVAPAPVLPRLERADDRMLGRPRVRRGMAVRRGITASDVPTRQTETQVNPPAPDPQAVLAPRNALRERGHLDRVEMGADVSQACAIPGQVVTRSPYIEGTPMARRRSGRPSSRCAQARVGFARSLSDHRCVPCPCRCCPCAERS